MSNPDIMFARAQLKVAAREFVNVERGPGNDPEYRPPVRDIATAEDELVEAALILAAVITRHAPRK